MAKKPENSNPDDTLSDVLGDDLAAKLRSPSDPGMLPGPAPWDVNQSVPATVPLPDLEQAPDDELQEVTDHCEVHQAAPEVHQAAPEVHQAAPVGHQAVPEVHQAAPEVHQAAPEVHHPETLDAPSHEPIDQRGTDEILAEVMPVRRFGKRQAHRAANELWPRLQRLPGEVLHPLWRRARAGVDALRLRISAWPRGVKIAVAATALSLVVGMLVVWLAPWSNRQYVQEPAWLSAGPSLEAADFPRAGVLQAREPVDIVREVGSLALVVDSVGRVGYVESRALGDAAPAAGPEQSFTRCGRLPGETEGDACESRAQKQRTECLRTCDEVVDVAGCTGNCEMRNNDCVAGCASAMVPVLPAGAEPEATPDDTTGEPVAGPAADADATENVEASTTERAETTSVKTTRKKPPRKKRRRSRKKR